MPQVPHKRPLPGAFREEPGVLVAEFAGAHDGVASHGELVRLGLGRRAIQSWVAKGQLHVIHHGVYAVGHRALSRRGYLRAALLACGDRAVLRRRTAAHLWDVSPTSSALIEITGPTHRRGGKGFRYAQSNLHPDDIAELHGFPVTSVARTLLDLAGVVQRDRLERAVERAARLRLLDERAVRAAIERSGGKKGRKLLASVIDSFDPATAETRSGNERAFLKLVRDHNLPKPLTNTLVEGFLVDFHWPEHNLIVELDSYATHGSEQSFHSDRERDAVLTDAGHQLLRITDVQLHTQPALAAGRIERRLHRR
jgi:very-short-patch-repair endonuclease